MTFALAEKVEAVFIAMYSWCICQQFGKFRQR